MGHKLLIESVVITGRPKVFSKFIPRKKKKFFGQILVQD